MTRTISLGHSMGASMCMLFAATHPEMVRRLIMLDAYKPMSRESDQVVDMTRLSGNLLKNSCKSFL